MSRNRRYPPEVRERAVALVAGGKADLLALAKAMPAAAAPRPVLHHPIDGLRRQQLAPLAPVSGLGALRAPGGIGALALRRPWRVLARRHGGVVRVAVEPSLQLGDPLVVLDGLLSDLPGQLLDLFVHAQQHRDNGLATLVIDRLGIGALYAKGFAGRRLCPPTRLNGYQKPPISGGFRCG